MNHAILVVEYSGVSALVVASRETWPVFHVCCRQLRSCCICGHAAATAADTVSSGSAVDIDVYECD